MEDSAFVFKAQIGIRKVTAKLIRNCGIATQARKPAGLSQSGPVRRRVPTDQTGGVAAEKKTADRSPDPPRPPCDGEGQLAEGEQGGEV